jgi:GNAT superfamily N-acetyltransferase
LPSTAPELASLQLVIDSVIQHLARRGLGVRVDGDFGVLTALQRHRGVAVNPAFDPAASDLAAADFWVALEEPEAGPVGWAAFKTITTNDLARSIARGTLWYRHGFAAHGGPAEMRLLGPSVRLAGTIGHAGALWIDPLWRGLGLARALAHLVRAIGFRDGRAMLEVGFVSDGLAVSGVPVESYGYLHVEPCIDGLFPPLRMPARRQLCWIDRATCAARVAELPHHAKHPIALVAASAPPTARMPAAADDAVAQPAPALSPSGW